MKLLYVVHQYGPNAGGSGQFVQAMAEESIRRGHEVRVLAGRHTGSTGDVLVTGRYDIVREGFNLVVVHGANPPTQMSVLLRAQSLSSPVLFLLVRPFASPMVLEALSRADFLGCSTSHAVEFAKRHGWASKARTIRCGIDPSRTVARNPLTFRQRFGIGTPRIFYSGAGYWPQKAMPELAQAFREANPSDTTLVLSGYTDFNEHTPMEEEDIRTLVLQDREDVMQAIASADLYVMNSTDEGCALVLFEAMLNRTPWLARDVGAAHDVAEHGTLYQNRRQLVMYLAAFARNEEAVDRAYEFVTGNHLIDATVDDLEKAAMEAAATSR